MDVFGFFILMMCVDNALAVQPGFQARITPEGLQFLTDVGVRELKEYIASATLPRISGTVDVLIWSADYTVSSMHVTSYHIPSASITTETDVGLRVSARGATIYLNGHWRYKLDSFLPTWGSGTFDLSMRDVTIAVTIEIGVDSTGRPTVHSSRSDCTFHVGQVYIHVEGGFSWLYNLFDDTIAGKIKDGMNREICGMVIDKVNTDLSEEVANIPIVASISENVEIDYSLVKTPIFNRSLTTSHKGEVYQKNNHSEAPYEIPTIPSDQDESKMVFIWMTDYLANSAGYVLQNIDFLQYNVTQDKVPEDFDVSLNTSHFAVMFLIPQLSELYPNMMMQLNLNTTQPPSATITSDQVGATVTGDVAAYAIQPNKTLTYLFTLGATMEVSVKLGFNRTALTWNSSYVSADLKLIRTAIDDFEIDLLRTRFQLACMLYIIPKINEFGATGFSVPSFDKYSMQDPKITQGEGFVKIGTDFVYDSQWEKKHSKKKAK